MLDHTRISGVVSPIITAFTEDGCFDEAAQREIIKYLIAYVHGFFPTGSYGCGALLNVEERKRIAEVVVDEVDHRKPVIVMTGAANTYDAIHLSKHAESIGADAVAVIPPYYFSYREKELFHYYADIIETVDIPVLAYNYPKVSNNSLSPLLVKKLAEIGLAGVKDSSMSLNNMHDYLMFIPKQTYPHFYHIIGTESLASAALAMGSDGVISGLSNAFPALLAQLWNAIQSHDSEAIVTQQMRTLKARALLKKYPTHSMVLCYEILRLRGVHCGFPRKPFLPASQEIVRSLQKELLENGFEI